MDIKEIIRLIEVKAGNVTDAELAKKIGITPQNFNNKLGRVTFKPSDLEKIANVLGYDLEISIINKENEERFKVY